MLDSSLIDSYLAWLKQQYQVNKLADSEEIVTPFTNSLGDNITIYVSSNDDGTIVLTDDFDTLGDLEMMGLNLLSPSRQRYLRNVLHNYKIQKKDGELFITGKKEDFPQMKQNLIQAIIRIDDLFLARKENNLTVFKDDVYSYLDNNDFGGLKTYRPDGRSGNHYVIDYTIPRRNNRPFRFINFSNASSFATIATASAMYGDISNGNEYNLSNSEFVIIYNSNQASPSEKSLNLASQFNLKMIPWADKQEILRLK